MHHVLGSYPRPKYGDRKLNLKVTDNFHQKFDLMAQFLQNQLWLHLALLIRPHLRIPNLALDEWQDLNQKIYLIILKRCEHLDTFS